jgi:hypothetical protein
MRPQPQGNGSGKVEIGQADMGGWVRVFAGKAEDAGRADLGVYLSQSLSEWFRQRPQLRLKCVVPISRDGTTVELHAWYEVHLLPPTALAPQPTEGPGKG